MMTSFRFLGWILARAGSLSVTQIDRITADPVADNDGTLERAA